MTHETPQNKQTSSASMSELWVIAVTNSMRVHREAERTPGVTSVNLKYLDERGKVSTIMRCWEPFININMNVELFT